MKTLNQSDAVNSDLSESKKTNRLLLLAVSLFVVSFFLPAFDGCSGACCAGICMVGVWYNATEWGATAYYFLFTLSNALMVIMTLLLITVFKRRKLPVWLLMTQIALIVHVVSWPLVVVAAFGEDFLSVQVGYYVWLLSMLLMLWCALRRRTMIQRTKSTEREALSFGRECTQ